MPSGTARDAPEGATWTGRETDASMRAVRKATALSSTADQQCVSLPLYELRSGLAWPADRAGPATREKWLWGGAALGRGDLSRFTHDAA